MTSLKSTINDVTHHYLSGCIDIRGLDGPDDPGARLQVVGQQRHRWRLSWVSRGRGHLSHAILWNRLRGQLHYPGRRCPRRTSLKRHSRLRLRGQPHHLRSSVSRQSRLRQRLQLIEAERNACQPRGRGHRQRLSGQRRRRGGQGQRGRG